jgi:ABC-type branched-subunit amino acid transport system ATPase component
MVRGADLVAEHVSVAYGGLRAVDDVRIEIAAGKVTGLLGPNGAGKTTLIDALSGFVRLASGTITLRGERIDDLPAHRRAALGLARTFQGLQLFEDLSVWENLLIAAEQKASRHAAQASVEAALATARARELAERLPVELSHGERSQVALARALASDPCVLLLDEPAAGLDSLEMERLRGCLQALRDDQLTVLLIDHDASFVLGVSDHVLVLDHGLVIASGPPEAVRRDPAVIEAYLGEGRGEPAPVAEVR